LTVVENNNKGNKEDEVATLINSLSSVEKAGEKLTK